MDIHDVPKQLCEKVTIGYSPEFFVALMHVGRETGAFALTPRHAKRLSQYLAHRVSEYEKEFGEIDAQWEPGVQSPIQPDELSHSSDESSEERGENADEEK